MGILRVIANAPYAIVIAVYLVFDVAKLADNWTAAGGIGLSTVLVLAAAAL